MSTAAPFVIDFETEAIQERPLYPPVPVGVSIKGPGKAPRYYAWGHPSGNNSSKEEVAAILKDIWRSGRELWFHHAKFDLDVAEKHFGLPLPAWDRIHDSMYLLFLKDPHNELSLKPSAERILGMPPEERDAVADWLYEHGVIRKNQGPGAFIARCDGKVVGKYANGDTDRTYKLIVKLLPQLDAKERVAYDRERKLMPILLENERSGVRFDIDRAEQDLPKYEKSLAQADDWLRKRLGSPGLNLDADEDVAEALDTSKVVTSWVWTKGGNGRAPQRSVAKANMTIDRFNDKEVFHVLGYRNRLQTVMGLNLRPWLIMAQENKGMIFTEWNQVRATRSDGDTKGTRTGRLSCSRFQNIVKSFDDRGDGWVQPAFLPSLPMVRSYLLPDKGSLFGHRDYNQQEFRILAHFEDGDLKEIYQKQPKTDYHTMIQTLLKQRFKVDYERRAVKTINFGILYGMGLGLLAAKTRLPMEVAGRLRRAVKDAAPGVAALDDTLKDRGRAGEHIRTWGGRRYFCEPPSWSEKHKRELTYEYKLLNYLIQGSAADCTKEALIRYSEARKDGRLLVTVHDEINISAPAKAMKREMKILASCMEGIEFDVPMITDGKVGSSWGDLKGE